MTKETEAIEALRKCVYEVNERGGRFGEDILSVRCKLCGKVSTDPNCLEHEKTCLLFKEAP
jgi:hypothetical protein